MQERKRAKGRKIEDSTESESEEEIDFDDEKSVKSLTDMVNRVEEQLKDREISQIISEIIEDDCVFLKICKKKVHKVLRRVASVRFFQKILMLATMNYK